MLKKTRRRPSSPAMWAVALIMGAPALVQAQTQLFPLAPIQRERVPCPMEDPIYGVYRHQYFGYYPTCWRQFPTGWGCPSPEAPNPALEFQRRKRDPLPEGAGAPERSDTGPAPIPGDQPGMPGNGRNPLPPLPPAERSPFDLESPPNTPGGRIPEPGTRTMPPPGAAQIDPPKEAPGESNKAVDASGPTLVLPDPAQDPATGTRPAPVGLPAENSGASLGGPAVGPTDASASLPGLANPGDGRPVMNRNQTPLPPSSPANVLAPSAVAPVAMPVQAPQRRGPLSTLFSGLSSRVRR